MTVIFTGIDEMVMLKSAIVVLECGDAATRRIVHFLHKCRGLETILRTGVRNFFWLLHRGH